ncbi:hypothetical protein [Paenibacillus tarimensis]|uniref:hypothetical protein n=1 Tax=Paenibacillus tarimensis TaxID=416012 RepID=UPI001F18F84C|nr:hypothetical protein [Paenibacillus tarimensis]MCF2943419.1 hypothetical protein [Paenibacillus tarimensis]
MSFLGFMFFSTIEGLAIYAFALYVFRMDLRKYIWHVLTMILLITFQNYITRDMLELSQLSTVGNLIVTALFFNTIIRIPMIWSLIMTVTGFIGLGIIQTLIIFGSFGYFSIEEAAAHAWKTYTIQGVTGVIGFLIGWGLYRKRLGFTFDFDNIVIKGERLFVITIIGLFILAWIGMVLFENVYLNLFGLLIALLIFLVYSIKKELAER